MQAEMNPAGIESLKLVSCPGCPGSSDQSSPFLITPNEVAHILILECIHFFFLLQVQICKSCRSNFLSYYYISKTSQKLKSRKYSSKPIRSLFFFVNLNQLGPLFFNLL